jgi:hypothetical protein
MMMVALMTMHLRKFKKAIHRFTTPARDIYESKYSYLLISCPLQSRRVAYKL